MNDQRKGLLADVALGIEAESFLSSGVGRFLVDRAETEVEQAINALKVADPADIEGIRKLQNMIHRGESIQYWLAECIQAGFNAEELLNQSDG